MLAFEKSGIYEIKNRINGKRYIGSAVLFGKRWKEHIRQLSENRHHSKPLQRAWNRYGADAFVFNRLLLCEKPNLIMYEQIYFDAYTPEYNCAPKAGSQLGYKHSDESRQKMSKANSRIGNPGHVHSQTSKEKISANRKGKGRHPCSEEKKAKLAIAHKGRIIPPEQRAQIAATLTGHKQSAEQIAKRVLKLRGRKMPEGFAEKTSLRMKGVSLPPRHCENIGKSKAKLTDDQVKEVRRLRSQGQSCKSLAQQFNIDASSISEISAHKTYRWVK